MLGLLGGGAILVVLAYHVFFHATQGGQTPGKRALTPAVVKQHFKSICMGDVVRYEAPNLLALNFILHNSLGGGGSESLKTDAQGKTHGLALLELEVER